MSGRRRATYPTVAKAEWPLRLPDGMDPSEVERLRGQVDELADSAQYGWGHTIDFGPFRRDGLLGDKYLRVAAVLDAWSWWPASLTGTAVADVGCFTGGLSALMAARGAESVEAVDEVPEHLDQCALVAGAFGLDTVRTHRASLYELPAVLAPASLDLIVLSGVLYHLSDMLVGLVACQQLLKPGGVLIVESNAVECHDHSYANFGRFVGGMWWQPTALCIADLCEHSGFTRPDVRFYQPGRALARVVKPADATVAFTRGMHWQFDDLRDQQQRGLDPAELAPAPCHHAELGMLSRSVVQAGERALRVPMSLGYRWRHRRHR